MIPSNKWFPQSLQERAAWYANFAVQAAASGASLGLSLADLTQIAQDAAMIAFLASSAVAMEDFSEALTQFRDILTTGDVGDTKPAFPAIPALVPPTIPPVGIFERVAVVYRPRIMASSIYTDAVGAQYGILASTSPIDQSDILPILKVFPADSGNVFAVVVTGRGDADMCEILGAEVGTNNWKTLGTLTGKSKDMTYANSTSKPVQMQFRAQLKKGNEDYGHKSDTVLATINP